MAHQRLTTCEVEAATRGLPGGAGPARLLEEKGRNQVFAVGEQAIFKAYLSEGSAKQARKIAALEFLAGRGLPLPQLLAYGGFPSFGTWQAGGPATLAAHVVPRASAIRAQAAGLDGVPPALLRRVGQELDRLEPAIREAGWLRPRLLHGDYGTSNVAAGPGTDGHIEVVAVFDFESAAPGDPVEDFLWTADHGLHSPIFRSFLAGYLEHGQLDPGAPARFAFYQLEHCLGVLGWTSQGCWEYFAQALWVIEQELEGARLRLA